MARNIQVLPINDFSGGLNLAADAFQLRGAETPDALNVDFEVDGGLSSRDGVGVLNSTESTDIPKNLWIFNKTDGTTQAVVQQGNDLAYSTGGNFTDVNPDALATTGLMRAASYKDALYVQRNAEQVVVKWSGSAASVLGTSFNDTLGSPAGGHMPKGKCIAAWQSHLWVANTVESATAHTGRVRFSHPNYPEDWRTDDYIDIDVGRDGGQITALAPVGDRLLVFTDVAVFAITGYDHTSFQMFEVARHCGAVSQEAVATTEYGVYFFSWPDGVFLYTGDKPRWVFRRIHPAIKDSSIPAVYQSTITMAWMRRRLWVSVPWETSTTPSRVFVLDPSLGEKKLEGSWTQYDLALGPMKEWRRPAATPLYLAASPTSKYVFKLHQDIGTDDFGAGAVEFESRYTTRWIDVDQPAVIKRWKRPEIIMDGGQELQLLVETFHNYDPSVVRRSATVTTDAETGALVWDDGTHAANMKWDDNVWAADGDGKQTIERITTLGRARAVQLGIRRVSPDAARWAINAINFKYIPRKVRN